MNNLENPKLSPIHHLKKSEVNEKTKKKSIKIFPFNESIISSKIANNNKKRIINKSKTLRLEGFKTLNVDLINNTIEEMRLKSKKSLKKLQSKKSVKSNRQLSNKELDNEIYLDDEMENNINTKEKKIMTNEEKFQNLVYAMTSYSRPKKLVTVIVDYLKTLREFMEMLSKLFADVSDLLFSISSHIKYEFCAKQRMIFRIGDIGEKFYIILRGSVKILMTHTKVYHLTKEEYIAHLIKLKLYGENKLFLNIIADLHNQKNFYLNEFDFSMIGNLKHEVFKRFPKEIVNKFNQIDVNNSNTRRRKSTVINNTPFTLNTNNTKKTDKNDKFELFNNSKETGNSNNNILSNISFERSNKNLFNKDSKNNVKSLTRNEKLKDDNEYAKENCNNNKLEAFNSILSTNKSNMSIDNSVLNKSCNSKTSKIKKKKYSLSSKKNKKIKSPRYSCGDKNMNSNNNYNYLNKLDFSLVNDNNNEDSNIQGSYNRHSYASFLLDYETYLNTIKDCMSLEETNCKYLEKIKVFYKDNEDNNENINQDCKTVSFINSESNSNDNNFRDTKILKVIRPSIKNTKLSNIKLNKKEIESNNNNSISNKNNDKTSTKELISRQHQPNNKNLVTISQNNIKNYINSSNTLNKNIQNSHINSTSNKIYGYNNNKYNKDTKDLENNNNNNNKNSDTYTSQAMNNLNNNSVKHKFIIHEYFEINTLKKGMKFGDLALEDPSGLRTASVLCSEDCHLGILDKEIYMSSFMEASMKFKRKNINFFLSLPVFRDIRFKIFERKVYHLMKYNIMNQTNILVQQNDVVDKVFFLKSGEFKLIFNGSLNDINSLLFKIAGKKRDITSQEKFLVNNDKLYSKELVRNISFEFKIISGKYILGFDELVDAKTNKAFFSIICNSNKSEYFEMNRKYYTNLEVFDTQSFIRLDKYSQSLKESFSLCLNKIMMMRVSNLIHKHLDYFNIKSQSTIASKPENSSDQNRRIKNNGNVNYNINNDFPTIYNNRNKHVSSSNNKASKWTKNIRNKTYTENRNINNRQEPKYSSVIPEKNEKVYYNSMIKLNNSLDYSFISLNNNSPFSKKQILNKFKNIFSYNREVTDKFKLYSDIKFSENMMFNQERNDIVVKDNTNNNSKKINDINKISKFDGSLGIDYSSNINNLNLITNNINIEENLYYNNNVADGNNIIVSKENKYNTIENTEEKRNIITKFSKNNNNRNISNKDEVIYNIASSIDFDSPSISNTQDKINYLNTHTNIIEDLTVKKAKSTIHLNKTNNSHVNSKHKSDEDNGFLCPKYPDKSKSDNNVARQLTRFNEINTQTRSVDYKEIYNNKGNNNKPALIKELINDYKLSIKNNKNGNERSNIRNSKIGILKTSINKNNVKRNNNISNYDKVPKNDKINTIKEGIIGTNQEYNNNKNNNNEENKESNVFSVNPNIGNLLLRTDSKAFYYNNKLICMNELSHFEPKQKDKEEIKRSIYDNLLTKTLNCFKNENEKNNNYFTDGSMLNSLNYSTSQTSNKNIFSKNTTTMDFKINNEKMARLKDNFNLNQTKSSVNLNVKNKNIIDIIKINSLELIDYNISESGNTKSNKHKSNINVIKKQYYNINSYDQNIQNKYIYLNDKEDNRLISKKIQKINNINKLKKHRFEINKLDCLVVDSYTDKVYNLLNNDNVDFNNNKLSSLLNMTSKKSQNIDNYRRNINCNSYKNNNADLKLNNCQSSELTVHHILQTDVNSSNDLNQTYRTYFNSNTSDNNPIMKDNRNNSILKKKLQGLGNNLQLNLSNINNKNELENMDKEFISKTTNSHLSNLILTPINKYHNKTLADYINDKTLSEKEVKNESLVKNINRNEKFYDIIVNNEVKKIQEDKFYNKTKISLPEINSILNNTSIHTTHNNKNGPKIVDNFATELLHTNTSLGSALNKNHINNKNSTYYSISDFNNNNRSLKKQMNNKNRILNSINSSENYSKAYIKKKKKNNQDSEEIKLISNSLKRDKLIKEISNIPKNGYCPNNFLLHTRIKLKLNVNK